MTADFANHSMIDGWLRHPVYGDVSFDTFERLPCNPVFRGESPYEWPVNGFLFHDESRNATYLYIGMYLRGYRFDNSNPMTCHVLRSRDKGLTWETVGPVFDSKPFSFDDNPTRVIHAPDVATVYAEGKYHMVYDWANEKTSWENAHEPRDGADSGIAYAWSEKPEGPFHRHAKPIHNVAALPKLLGKYRRIYAPTIIRRRHDWLVLAMMDSGPHFSWALVGCVSRNPEGPYSLPQVLLSPDSMAYYPPLLEFYPAFTHDGWIYAPATSVALNRNYQALFRAKIENAHDPSAWELVQAGSLWHSTLSEYEHHGIWGQTFSGWVSSDGYFRVMYPSRDSLGMGTINLAIGEWKRPFRKRGFFLESKNGPSLVLLKQGYSRFSLKVRFSGGGKISFLWDYAAPLGPNEPRADATLHPASLSNHKALSFDDQMWRVQTVDQKSNMTVLAEGSVADFKSEDKLSLSITRNNEDMVRIQGNTREVFLKHLPSVTSGLLGILLAPQSVFYVDEFKVSGKTETARLRYLSAEALLGAGQSLQQWEIARDPHFVYGFGAISREPDARAKWNFEGTGFALWAPKSPQYGHAEVFVDGSKPIPISFKDGHKKASAPLLQMHSLRKGRHALVIVCVSGRVPIDMLEVTP